MFVSLLASSVNLRDLSKVGSNVEIFFDGNYKYKYNINSAESSPLNDIDTVNLKFLSGTINFEYWDKNEISVTANGDVRSSSSIDDIQIKKEVSGKNISFSLFNSNNSFLDYIFSKDLSVTVKLPKSFNKNLNITSTSSNITIENNDFSSLDIKVTSGDINVTNSKVNSLSITSTSGDMHLNNIASQSSTLRDVSGRIDTTNFSGDIDCKTVSGNINIDYSKLNPNNKISTTSGDTMLAIPSTETFNLEQSSISGDVRTNFTSNSNSNNKIKFSSTSGNLNIRQK
jgi:Uncharacterized conserved protein